MNKKPKQEHRAFFPEGNYMFPKLKGDPGYKRYDKAVEAAGFKDWLEISHLMKAAKTEEERNAIYIRIPMKPLYAVFLKKRMGKEAFLAEGYNLDYANGELGGTDWMDKY
jgi:hypothetical protein